MTEHLYRVIGKDFCAGMIERNGRIAQCAPILHSRLSPVGKSVETVKHDCLMRGFKIELVETE